MPEICQLPTMPFTRLLASPRNRLAAAERQFHQDVGVQVVADVEVGIAIERVVVIGVQHDGAGHLRHQTSAAPPLSCECDRV
jgi:hypothetical protein